MPQRVVEALVSWLPQSEFAVALGDRADVVLVVESGGTVEAAAVVLHDGPTLAGSGATASCAGALAAADLLGRALGDLMADQRALEVAGPEPLASAVARVAAQGTGGPAMVAMEQRLMVATEARPPSQVVGDARRLAATDRDVVAGWVDAFMVEALGRSPQGAEPWLEGLERTDRTAVWTWVVNDEPVAMLRARWSTPVSSRLGLVYCPPELRGNGYARALTAHVTADVLAAGATRVTLLTDATNPTSNELYARVGFRDVGAHGTWRVTV